jgi:NADH-quinone oxidoreductase subunit N
MTVDAPLIIAQSVVDWRTLFENTRDYIMPETILTLFACLALVLDAILPRDKRRAIAYVSLLGTALSAVSTVMVYAVNWRRLPMTGGFSGMLVIDEFSLVFKGIFLLGLALSIGLSVWYLDVEREHRGEFYSLMLFATVGMMFMASGSDLLTLYIALELMALPVYILVGYLKRSNESNEASMKYFLLGAFATSFLLYGIALIYGATGSTNLDRIAASAAAKGGDPLVLVGLGLLLVGFGFKISSVPFHMWAPDVYEGAPTTITALIATGSKAAAFAALIRILVVALRGAQADWSALLWGVAALTMTVGNVVAVAQSNLKRMLAYSSIAHVGYMLMGLVAGGVQGAGAVLFYLLAYTFTTVGAFGVIALCARAGEEAVEVGDYAGLARRHPVLAVTLALFLLSLIGIPPLAGFVAKFYLFGSAVRAGYIWLTVIAVLNSAVAAYYYLRVIVYMYMREPEGERMAVTPSFAGALALAIALVGIVLLGIAPAPFADLAQAAVAPLLR